MWRCCIVIFSTQGHVSLLDQLAACRLEPHTGRSSGRVQRIPALVGEHSIRVSVSILFVCGWTLAGVGVMNVMAWQACHIVINFYIIKKAFTTGGGHCIGIVSDQLLIKFHFPYSIVQKRSLEIISLLYYNYHIHHHSDRLAMDHGDTVSNTVISSSTILLLCFALYSAWSGLWRSTKQ